MDNGSITYVDFTNHKTDPPYPVKQTAAPAGSRNGGEGIGRAWGCSELTYSTLKRADKIASNATSDATFAILSAALWDIGLTDELSPDRRINLEEAGAP